MASTLRQRMGLLLFGTVVGLGMAELFLYLGPPNSSDFAEATSRQLYKTYSPEELDESRGRFTAEQGAACVSTLPASPLHYHLHFGFNRLVLDEKCAKFFFQQHKDSVVFFGGSVMEGAFAPNHLSTIVSSVHRELPQIVSVNLAESGSRSTNEMVRLLLEGLNLAPKAIVFLDGFNEFNSIRYGGSPSDDFYWTAGVKDRITNPTGFLLERSIRSSKLLSLVLLKSGVVRSAAGPHAAPSDSKIAAAAALYHTNRKKIELLCRAKNIECLFFIQPTIFSKNKLSPREQAYLTIADKEFPEFGTTMRKGYSKLLVDESGEGHTRPLDLTHLFDDLPEETIFIDAVHTGKLGNHIVGKAIAQKMAAVLEQESP